MLCYDRGAMSSIAVEVMIGEVSDIAGVRQVIWNADCLFVAGGFWVLG